MSPLERPRLCAGKSNGEKGPFLSGNCLFAPLDVVAVWRVGCSVASPLLRERSSRRKNMCLSGLRSLEHLPAMSLLYGRLGSKHAASNRAPSQDGGRCRTPGWVATRAG